MRKLIFMTTALVSMGGSAVLAAPTTDEIVAMFPGAERLEIGRGFRYTQVEVTRDGETIEVTIDNRTGEAVRHHRGEDQSDEDDDSTDEEDTTEDSSEDASDDDSSDDDVTDDEASEDRPAKGEDCDDESDDDSATDDEDDEQEEDEQDRDRDRDRKRDRH